MSIQFITYYKPFKMNQAFIKNWWIFLFRGLLSVSFGLLALALPDITLPALLLIVGAYIFGTSILFGAAIINTRKSLANWKWLIVSVVLCLTAGLTALINPFATAIALMYLVGACVLLAGISEIMMAVRLRNVVRGEGWYILAGVLAVLFGLSVFFNPFEAVITLTIIFGIYAVIAGIMLIYLSFRLKNLDALHHQSVYNLL